jgi:hypothetical protein
MDSMRERLAWERLDDGHGIARAAFGLQVRPLVRPWVRGAVLFLFYLGEVRTWGRGSGLGLHDIFSVTTVGFGSPAQVQPD